MGFFNARAKKRKNGERVGDKQKEREEKKENIGGKKRRRYKGRGLGFRRSFLVESNRIELTRESRAEQAPISFSLSTREGNKNSIDFLL